MEAQIPQTNTPQSFPRTRRVNSTRFLLLLLAVVIVVIGIMSLMLWRGKAPVSSPSHQTTQEISPTPEFTAAEVNNFPVYQQATFSVKHTNPSCKPGEQNTDCGTKTYTWTTSDDHDQVYNWYKAHIADTGWSCDKDTVSSRQKDSTVTLTPCHKGNLTQEIAIATNAVGTRIILYIPQK